MSQAVADLSELKSKGKKRPKDNFEYESFPTDRGPGRRRRYKPTDENRKAVRAAVIFDVPVAKIAEYLGITVKALLRHHADDLAVRTSHADVTEVSETLSAAIKAVTGIFPSARKAIQFAVSVEGAPARPVSSRMLDASNGGRDFFGLDAAAQAGMILNVIESLGPLPAAILIADASPRSIPCNCRRPCCSGHKASRYWRDAIDRIAQAAVEKSPKGGIDSYALRSAVIVKIYGQNSKYIEIANELRVNEETVSRHHRAILTWLRGAKAGKDREAVEGLEQFAWREAESVLRIQGIVG